MEKIRILFQGDSVTDCGRIRADITSIGGGYPAKTVAELRRKYPDAPLEFINKGCGGDETADLLARVERDIIELQPDILSILIGINDTLHPAEQHREWMPHNLFEEHYRAVLTAVKERTHAKIMILEPFIVPVADKLCFREDFSPKLEIVRKLAREYADVLVPLDGLINAAVIGREPEALSHDGIHPTSLGSDIITENYVRCISPLIDALIAE